MSEIPFGIQVYNLFFVCFLMFSHVFSCLLLVKHKNIKSIKSLSLSLLDCKMNVSWNANSQFHWYITRDLMLMGSDESAEGVMGTILDRVVSIVSRRFQPPGIPNGLMVFLGERTFWGRRDQHL